MEDNPGDNVTELLSDYFINSFDLRNLTVFENQTSHTHLTYLESSSPDVPDVIQNISSAFRHGTTFFQSPFKHNSSDWNFNSTTPPWLIFLDDPMEVKSPHKFVSMFVPIIVTHAMTFIFGILGNVIMIASLVKERVARNITR